MIAYRICKSQYSGDISGLGAKMFGGRWNRPGVAVLYTSSARSLAILELLVHFNAREALNNDFVIMEISFPDESIVPLDSNLLPKDGFIMNDSRFWDLTERYFFQLNTLVLKVPSMVVTEEFNYIINMIFKKSFLTVSIISF